MEIYTDPKQRRCPCGKQFRITDYPLGYFAFNYQVVQGSAVNTCPDCEVKIIRGAIRNYLLAPEPILDKERRRQENSVVKLQQDVHLLLTGNPANEQHRKNITKMTI